jgi:glycosyltransferase involved in cell wall biosynthesis
MAEAPTPRPGRELRVALVGVSEGDTCGVRDHGELLVDGLAAENVACSRHWLTRRAHSLPGARAEFRGWAAELARELEAERPEAVVLQYSVFSYSYRGFPVFVRDALAAVRAPGVPLVTVLHEFVYPWGRGGVKGKAWALSQAAALRGVIRESSAAVVTAPFRAEWLASRAWLARREIGLAPVYSNLPPPRVQARAGDRDEPLLGLFGYAYEGAAMSLVLDALQRLHELGHAARLLLLGAPGPDSAAGAAWLQAARARGLEHAVSFSGVLPADELSDALAACDVLLHPEPSGPTSRKGTLAASLASGTAVVAIDGPRRWAELADARAAHIVEPSAAALAGGIAVLLGERSEREELGARGAQFARTAMGVGRTAGVLAEILRGLLADEQDASAGAGRPDAPRQVAAGSG